MEYYGTQPFHNGCGLTARRWTAAGSTAAGTRCRWTVASRPITAGSSSARTAIAAAAIGLTAAAIASRVLAQESVCALGLAARQLAIAVAIKSSYQTGPLLWSQLRSASFAAFTARRTVAFAFTLRRTVVIAFAATTCGGVCSLALGRIEFAIPVFVKLFQNLLAGRPSTPGSVTFLTFRTRWTIAFAGLGPRGTVRPFALSSWRTITAATAAFGQCPPRLVALVSGQAAVAIFIKPLDQFFDQPARWTVAGSVGPLRTLVFFGQRHRRHEKCQQQ